MKSCPRCKETKPLSEFHVRKSRGGQPASRCKSCNREANRSWRHSRPNYERERYQRVRVETRERHLIRKYGVTLADYEQMLAKQDGKCAICGEAESAQRYGVFHVDHCHTTGVVRGLLCRGCNHVLGHVKDSTAVLECAIAYLAAERQQVAA